MRNFYSNINQANEVLDYYEKYLLKCEYIVFIAVVEKVIGSLEGFSLQFGILKKGKKKVKIDDSLTRDQIVNGCFKDNTIPSYLPLDDKFSSSMEDVNKDFYKTFLEYNNGKERVDYIINWLDDPEPLDQLLSKRGLRKVEKANFIKSYPLVSKKYEVETTLGGLFKIKEYPNAVFGITNYHLFDYPDARLGDIVLDRRNGKEIANLFWKANDLEKEVSFLKMDNNNFKVSDSITNFIRPTNIAEAKLGQKVYHNGQISGRNSKDQETKIVSLNATVRVFRSRDPERWTIYKNQILIEQNTRNGDSGSLVITENDKIVGLNFARSFGSYKVAKTDKKEGSNTFKAYSYANHINNIFNYSFPRDQEVYHKISKEDKNIIVTRLLEQFTLK